MAVCKHIRENVDVSKLLSKGCHFNAIVNNADFFSGHIYSDGGTMYWGTIQQRTDSIDNCQLYKYFSSGGADTVIPFKKGYENTPATAVAAEILKGKTAWVNGILLTGTLVATTVSKTESKSSSYGIGGYGSTTVTLTYSNTVLGVVSYSITDSNNYAKLTSISISGTKITFGMQTYHGHGASGTLKVTARIQK